LDRLYGAVALLTDPIKELVDGVVMAAPSLWEQLCDDIPAKAGESGGRSHSRSLPPVYCDAVDLKADIDSSVRQWHPHGRSTPERLRRLASARWRPQDAERLERHADDLQRWTVAIRTLLEPERVKEIAAPCPACGVSVVYRMRAGERVRQSALQIIAATGCRCLNCNAHWAPDTYMLLLKVLGFDKPAGVLD